MTGLLENMANLRYYNFHRTMKTSGVNTAYFHCLANKCCSQKKASDGDVSDIPDPPTDCCNSGCDNCVWIVYAEELLNKFVNGGEVVRKKIEEKVKDPSMKAFLLAELKALEKDKL